MAPWISFRVGSTSRVLSVQIVGGFYHRKTIWHFWRGFNLAKEIFHLFIQRLLDHNKIERKLTLKRGRKCIGLQNWKRVTGTKNEKKKQQQQQQQQ